MKKIIIVILLFVASTASSQIVNIPDPNFKQYLLQYWLNIDANQDGEIQVSEALTVTSLIVQNLNITDLTGIRSFANLETLNCDGNQLAILDVSGMTLLKNISCFHNLITTLNLNGCNNLKSLDFNDNKISHLDLRPFPNFEVLSCDFNPTLVDIIAEGCPKLRGVRCYQNGGNLSYVNLKNCDSLRFLDCSYIGTLDISGSKKFQTLNQFISIGNVIARECTGLTKIQSPGLTTGIGSYLDVTGCINLETFIIEESGIVTIDFSSCTNLKTLKIEHSSQLRYLNIKNGSSLNTLYIDGYGYPFNNPTNGVNICTDDFETTTVINTLTGNRPFFVSSYCSFYPGGAYNTIKGKVTRDINNNGCDPTDFGMPNVPIKFTDTSGQSIVRYTGTNGLYDVFTYKGIFSVLPYFPYAYFNINPANATITFDTANSLIDSVNFCIAPNGVYNDLDISFLPTAMRARPGFPATYLLTYRNRGTTTLSGNVQLNFNSSRMNFGSASPIVSSQSTGQLTWNYNNLQPFENRTIDVQFNLLPPPVNNIGDTIYYQATVNPVTGDYTPINNSFTLPQLVRGAYDPNEKECIEGSKIVITAIDNFLHYVIHFQNLGTDTAFNVVVVDTLSAKLDWNSFEFIGSSHICHVTQKNNKLEFFFENIELPYKAINEPASNGFVAFKIKPRNTVVVGDSLKNKAAIYFDFNPPVITNTATTVISSAGPIPVRLEYFFGNSRVGGNFLSWKAPSTNGITNFSIERSADSRHFNSIGNITASVERCKLPFDFTDANRLSGKNYYRLKITDADGIFFYSKTLVIGNSNQSLEIISITNDQGKATIYLNSTKQQTLQLKLIAADGKLVYAESRTVSAGNSQSSLRMELLATGVYYLLINTNEGELITKRFVK